MLRYGRQVAALFLVAGLCSGCLSWLHPIRPNHDVLCQSPLPQASRDHVYIFILHGLDPLDYANLRGLRAYLGSLGYCNTYLGQMYHGHTFAEEIRRIHCSDPDARYVVMGFSAGANVANLMAHSLREKNGIDIDLLVYMGGNTLKNEPDSRPENVGKVVHILATGYVWKGYHLDGAENYKYADVWHFGSPTHPKTLEVLEEELAIVAGRVPIRELVSPPEPVSSPTPRPVSEHRSERRDEWDFLKPAAELTPLDPSPGRGTVVSRKPVDD